MDRQKALKTPRSEFMSNSQKSLMGNLPRTHLNCIQKTGVARPGKTAKDRALKS